MLFRLVHDSVQPFALDVSVAATAVHGVRKKQEQRDENNTPWQCRGGQEHTLQEMDGGAARRAAVSR